MNSENAARVLREWWPVFLSMVTVISSVVLVYAAIDKRLSLIEKTLTDIAVIQNQVANMEERLGGYAIRLAVLESKVKSP